MFGSLLDAYTVRKIAPRLIVAVIGINLSIYLCVAAVDVTNIIGGGLGDLLREPFHASEAFKNPEIPGTKFNAVVGGAGIVGIVGTGAVVGAAAAGGTAVGATGIMATIAGGAFGTVALGGLAALGMFLLVAMISVALIALAIAATVIIRYGAIIILTIISPVAIAMLVLPGTEKYFKQWWDIFMKVLIMYPIIAVLFAISDILASILMVTLVQKGDLSALIGIFIVILALYAPLFMIPFAFKLAGGIIGGVYDFANKNGVAKVGEKVGNWKKNPNSWYGKAANKRRGDRRASGATFDQQMSGLGGGLRNKYKGKSFRAGRRDALTYGATSKVLADVEQAEKENEAAKAVGIDDDQAQIVRLMSMGYSRSQSAAMAQTIAAERWASDDPENRDAANFAGIDDSSMNGHLKQADELIKGVGKQVAGVMAIKAIAPTKTGWTDPEEMMDNINSVAGDDRSLAKHLLGYALDGQEKAGRVDNSAFGYSVGMEELENNHRIDGDTTLDDDGKRADKTKSRERLDHAAIKKSGSGKIISMHEKAAQNLLGNPNSNAVMADLRAAQAEVTRAEAAGETDNWMAANVRVERETARLTNIYDLVQQASPEIAEKFADNVLSQKSHVDEAGRTVSVLESIGDMRGNPDEHPEFAKMRRDFKEREYEAGRNREEQQ